MTVAWSSTFAGVGRDVLDAAHHDPLETLHPAEVAEERGLDDAVARVDAAQVGLRGVQQVDLAAFDVHDPLVAHEQTVALAQLASAGMVLVENEEQEVR